MYIFIIGKPRILGTIARRSLQERLDAGETILCAEGYVLGLARRGYVGTGVWTGQFMLDYPDVLTSMHYEFVHCGSDVVQALQVILTKLCCSCNSSSTRHEIAIPIYVEMAQILSIEYLSQDKLESLNT